MRRKRVLAVDDEPAITRMVKLNLERAGGYEVEEENMGTKAIETARKFKPDVILLDIIMPDVEGHFLADQFKNDAEFSGTPIIFLTAVAEGMNQENDIRMFGGYPALSKPVKIRDLVQSIEDVLEHKESA